jgi:hypothetical protein
MYINIVDKGTKKKMLSLLRNKNKNKLYFLVSLTVILVCYNSSDNNDEQEGET